MIISNVLFSPGCVLNTLGKLVIDRGSSIVKVVVRVAQIYVNAKTIGLKMHATNRSSNVRETW